MQISTLKQINDNSVQLNDYNYISYKKTFNIEYRKIIFVLLFIILLLSSYIIKSKHNSNTSDNPIINNSESNVNYPFSKDGFIFPESSQLQLTEDEIINLLSISEKCSYSYQDLLRYSINEIYARHGFTFKQNSKFDLFYNNFEWYKKLGKSSVSWNELNNYEQSNINLLVYYEKINGFR